MIELIVVVGILALLALFLLPEFVKARQRAQRIRCNGFLKQISLGSRQWALDNTNANPWCISTNLGGTREYLSTGEVWPHFQVMSNELNTPFVLVCPSDKERVRAKDFHPNLSNTNIGYFVGFDANDSMPQMFLAGDRNIIGGALLPNRILSLTSNDAVRWDNRMHQGQGNVAMADGSVQQVSSARLREALRLTGVVTNRLAMP